MNNSITKGKAIDPETSSKQIGHRNVGVVDYYSISQTHSPIEFFLSSQIVCFINLFHLFHLFHNNICMFTTYRQET